MIENGVREQNFYEIKVLCSGFFSFKQKNMKILSVIRNSSSRCFAALLVVLFFFVMDADCLKAQDKNYNIGFRGGVGMSTLNGFTNNGLKLGITGGVCGKYLFSENSSIIADINYSMGGQQQEKWSTDNGNEQVKIYGKYSLHYISTPVLYQYYFTDILGIEAGVNFRYCLNGNLKTKIGNESWKSADLSHNTFDFGLIFGIYTENLIPSDNFFVSLRAYFGFLDVIKDVGTNKNVSVQVCVGYMIF